jgi:NTP pyrophosphatase (non-canonical NTP hydrolase)
MKTLEQLQQMIIEWAKERNIHLPECAPKQRLKLIEEVGELASAILKNDIEKQKDAIGDIFVVLVILAEQLGIKISFNYDVWVRDLTVLFEIITFDTCITSSLAALNDTSTGLNLDLTECANIAWNEIKDRTGRTENGIFLKD